MATVAADLDRIPQALEERTLAAFRQEELTTLQTEYAKYFDALQKHPRLLVGTEVPNLRDNSGREMETLRSSEDAADWQEALKAILVSEMNERVRQRVESVAGAQQTLIDSAELFRNNKDLVPGTKQFDKELADGFIRVARPYMVRENGKLQGFSIPVQPLIDSIRSDLVRQRAAAPKAPAAPPPAPKAPAAPPPAPQAGIQSKAGASSSAPEDYSVLFGTLGMPDFRF